MNIRLTLCACALAATTGCVLHKYTPLPLTPEAWAATHPKHVRVLLQDGTRLTLFDPMLAGDTLRGDRIRHDRALPTRVATRDVLLLEARRIDWPMSIGVSTLVAGATVGAVIAIANFRLPDFNIPMHF
ncbi:MAG: hypothetical protein ABSB58_09585 [Gemmatimonadales bacterium]